MLWGVLAAAAAGCVLDTDDRCGPGQVAWPGDERCVCAEGSAYTPDGCVPCGANETASANGCICATGFSRGDDGLCAEITGGMGAPCTTSVDCEDPVAPHCQPSPGGSYCTSQGCDATGCPNDFSCNVATSPSYCQRRPTGDGRPCTSDADCAGSDADYCELGVSGTCLVRNCSVSPNSCFTGYDCCDFTAFFLPTLCLAEGLCQQ